MNPTKVRIFKARIAGLWIYDFPTPDGGDHIRGWATTHGQAVTRVSILIKAWWHR